MLEDLENQNSAFLNDFGSIDSDNDDDSEYDMFKFRNSRTRESNEAIVSCLPCETLRWIKKRRKINSKLKVAMSFFRERQLREIFNGLDYKTQGEIDLNDLKLAVQYVEDSLKGRKGEQLQNLQGMFAAMDEDGMYSMLC